MELFYPRMAVITLEPHDVIALDLAIRKGEIVQGIKYLRARFTGLSLRDAKAMYDAYRDVRTDHGRNTFYDTPGDVIRSRLNEIVGK